MSNYIRVVYFFFRQNAKNTSIALAAVLLGIFVAILDGQSRIESSNTTDAWALPLDPKVIMTSQLETLLAKPLFGGEPVLSGALQEALVEEESDLGEWRLVGIVSEGSNQMIIFENAETGKLEEAQVGDTLPGGEQILDIGQNSIELMADDIRAKISLFQDINRVED